ncbi:hypothetical protein GC093_15355 [Paenibacillus sp. LMG 31456]|uniref:Uncharacterized protein n=1 Tax=Paenibacillus foliorum TaxID=2654974 RepID=A0A972GPM3_9BACL|nr:hypothetical protein [Paenibacillus foliorum]NOU94586.1 hypothetical protein [Paenibacillus foliorum]
MDWFLQLSWWQYLIIGIVTFISGVLIMNNKYSMEFDSLVDGEYERISRDYWFLGFRQSKQAELKSKAKHTMREQYPNLSKKIDKYQSISAIPLILGPCCFLFGIFLLGSALFNSVDAGEGNGPSDYYINETGSNPGPGIHNVDPHWVNSYQRSDGTQVNGYWRGGNDGYNRSNPDGKISNNLGSRGSSSNSVGRGK